MHNQSEWAAQYSTLTDAEKGLLMALHTDKATYQRCTNEDRCTWFSHVFFDNLATLRRRRITHEFFFLCCNLLYDQGGEQVEDFFTRLNNELEYAHLMRGRGNT